LSRKVAKVSQSHQNYSILTFTKSSFAINKYIISSHAFFSDDEDYYLWY